MPDIKTALQQALEKAKSEAHAHPSSVVPADWDDEGGAAVIETVTTQPQQEATMPKKFFQVTTNVTEATFAYVRDNPGKTRVEVIQALETQGFHTSSVSSLIGQFVKQGQFVRRNSALFATVAQRAPLKASQKKAQRAAAAIQTPTPAHIPAPKAAPAPTKVTTARAGLGALVKGDVWDVEALLETLSIKQARSLYDALRTIFGA